MTLSPEQALEAVLGTIFSEDYFDDSVADTAKRIVKFWEEFANDKMDFKFTTFPAESSQMIGVRDIEFSSLCAHHLLPFYGRAHVAYIPTERQVGLSKIPRLVRYFAKRPQVQEQLTEQIAKYLKKELNAMGVMVIIEARHTCMSCRGVRAHNAAMVTSVVKGVFMSAPAARAEFLELIGRRSV